MQLGLALPIGGLPLGMHDRLLRGISDAGFGGVWSAEGGGPDAFTPLAAAAAWSPSLRLGTAVVPVSTRGPGVLAQTAATLAELAPGRFTLGIGSSVPAHVSAINGMPFERPYARVRDTLRFLRAVLGGQAAAPSGTVPVAGFRLARPPEIPPRIIVGALRPGMLDLAFREGDGAITNVLAADDLPKIVSAIEAPSAGKELAVKVFVCPTADTAFARRQGRSFLTWILNQPPSRAFHAWLGRDAVLKAMHERWDAGDPGGAAAALPDEVVDELWIHGTPEECRARIERYLHPAVTTAVLYVAPVPEIHARPDGVLDLLRRLRPAQPARRDR